MNVLALTLQVSLAVRFLPAVGSTTMFVGRERGLDYPTWVFNLGGALCSLVIHSTDR